MQVQFPAPGELKERLRQALISRTRVPMAQGPVPAAVLIPLFLKNGEFHLLFTKRTSQMTHHRGEISFPGGVREEGDRNNFETALRESWEEVGIRQEDVELLGELDDCYSIYNYVVTPVVGCIPANYPLTINHAEIERIIEVPLAHFRVPGVFRTELWERQGRLHPVYFYTYGEDEIWGLTARILKQFLEVMDGREEESSGADPAGPELPPGG